MSVPVLPVTLLVLSDFELGRKTWADEIACVASFVDDRHARPSEIIVLAPEADFTDHQPPDWSRCAVPVRVHAVPSGASTSLKNVGAALACHDLIAVVEADSPVEPGWLRTLYDRIRATPSVAIVSGITIYEPRSALRRVMSMYDRGYLLTRSRSGEVVQFSSNGALFRREVLERYPLSDDPSPFVAAHKRQRAFEADRLPMDVVTEAVQLHAFGGWAFVHDLRRNKGYQFARMQEVGADTWWRRSAFLRKVAAVATAFRSDCSNLIRLYPFYCRWYDLPVALFMLAANRAFEWQGAGDALRGLDLPAETAFR